MYVCIHLYNSPDQNLGYFQLSRRLPVPFSINATWRVTSFFYRFLKLWVTQIIIPSPFYFLKGLDKLIRPSFLSFCLPSKCSVQWNIGWTHLFCRKPTSLPGVQTRITLDRCQGHFPWKDFSCLEDMLAGLQFTIQHMSSAQWFHVFCQEFPNFALELLQLLNRYVPERFVQIKFYIFLRWSIYNKTWM